MNGPGRLRRAARRAILAGGGTCTTRQAVEWAWPNRPAPYPPGHYKRIRKVLGEFCERVGYQWRGGIVWRAERIERARSPHPMTGRLWWQRDTRAT
jgi:hypothetical protein